MGKVLFGVCAMYDEDDYRTSDDDKLFDELDEMVDFAKESIRMSGNPDRKYDVRLSIINLIMEEVMADDIRIYRQIDNSWVAEVKYKGINFISIVGKRIPPAWAEIMQESDDEDDEEDDEGTPHG